MCILCQMGPVSGTQSAAASYAAGRIQHGNGAVSGASASGNVNVDALISGFKWSGTSMTFALPANATSFAGYNAALDETGSFSAVSGDLATAVRAAMSHISAYSGLTITETGNAASATMLLGRTNQTQTAHAYLPDGYFKGGDVWFGLSEDYDSPVVGNYGYSTVLHEIGHALGLKHAHTYIGGMGAYGDDVGVVNAPVAAALDSLEFTIMTYRSYVGQDIEIFDAFTNAPDSFPQTLMMLDIAALQRMYGADFSTQAGNTVYAFNPFSGQMAVNGVVQEALAGNRIFRTIWDGGGTDTYDFSNYTTNQSINLEPGNWSLLSLAQRAELGPGNLARGNVFNALQFGSDTRSLIENANGGAGNDSIIGNAAANMLTGNDGADYILGVGGDDALHGGFGNDSLYGGDNNDLLIAGLGLDYLDGQGENDALYGGDNNDTVVGNIGDDYLDGQGENDELYGNDGRDIMVGNHGNDYLDGGDGRDELYGNDNNDILFGNLGDDYLDGQGETDTLYGGSGADTLYGNVGGDQIWGGIGTDSLIGGNGDDQFRFQLADLQAGVRDVIADFAEAGGGNADLLVFLGITAGSVATVAAAGGTLVTIAIAGGTAEILVQGFAPSQLADQMFFL